jgi:ribosomal protein S18 acetylase RimI-like enzyme
MQIQKEYLNSKAIKFIIIKNNKQIARAHLYIIKNDLHNKPYAYIEDVYVNENHRGQGFGKKLINYLISQAKQLNCYKIICTSRNNNDLVHNFYKNQGFKEHGKEFRINL